jgi:hypothetical protein
VVDYPLSGGLVSSSRSFLAFLSANPAEPSSVDVWRFGDRIHREGGKSAKTTEKQESWLSENVGAKNEESL